jgi:hypothetical protein
MLIGKRDLSFIIDTSLWCSPGSYGHGSIRFSFNALNSV